MFCVESSVECRVCTVDLPHCQAELSISNCKMSIIVRPRWVEVGSRGLVGVVACSNIIIEHVGIVE